jgi:hypothetical protein
VIAHHVPKFEPGPAPEAANPFNYPPWLNSALDDQTEKQPALTWLQHMARKGDKLYGPLNQEKKPD